MQDSHNNSFTSPDLENKIGLLERIFANSDGKVVSKEYRDRLEIEDKSYVYGEIKFPEFYQILAKCQPNSNQIFYDLGSGAGKPSVAAALFFDFKKSVGIEIVPELCKLATKNKEALQGSPYESCVNRIEFINGDATKEDLTGEDAVVFLPSTCFTKELFDALVANCHSLKSGSYVICLTKSIESAQFELIYESKDLAFSWGNPTTRIYRKI